MFGQNPIRKKDHAPASLRVQEIFHTIQGEGPFAGTPAVFLRLAGCNLRCTFCDTDFESNYDNVMSYEDVVLKIRQVAAETNTRLLVITGGEPMLQNFLPIIRVLGAGDRWHTQIETAGTLWLPGLEWEIRCSRASIVCSPKTPKVHPLVTLNCRAWKYIIRATPEGHLLSDGLPCMSTQSEERQMIYRPPMTYTNKIYLQPCDEGRAANYYNTQLAAQLCMQHGYTLCLQLHKLVGLS